MIDWIGEAPTVALIGAIGGVMLGLAARMGRFCTLGAIEDVIYGGTWTRARMWGVALGAAILLTFAAQAAGFAQIDQSFYLSNTWSPAAVIGGGLLFGYGMAMAGNCGFGALARLGGGDMRSFVIVLVMGLSALVALSGPLAYIRVRLTPLGPAATEQGIAHALAGAFSVPAPMIGMAVGALILAAALWDRAFRQERASILWALVIAAAISSAWVGTTWVATTGFAATPITTHTFAAPIGGTMIWLMTASGTAVTFGVGSVGGVLLGAFIGSLIKGHFRWEACEDPRELKRQIMGAVCMGIGAVFALGCSVGQGLSAFSVLAYSAPLVSVSIVAGAAFGLKQLITGFRALDAS